MKKSYKYLWLILFGVTAVGFADCSYHGVYISYTLDACPPQDFSWPKEAKSAKLELSREVIHESNVHSCSTLIPYRTKVKNEEGGILSKGSWLKSISFIGLLRQPKCRIIFATAGSSINLSQDQLKKGAQYLEKRLPKILNLLFSENSFKPNGKVEEVKIINDKDEFTQWCESLSPSE